MLIKERYGDIYGKYSHDVRQVVLSAFEDLEGNAYTHSDLDEAIYEIADTNTPIYYSKLYNAVGELDRLGLCDEVVQEGLIDVENFSCTKMLQMAYYQLIERELFLNRDTILYNRCVNMANEEETDISEDDIENFVEEQTQHIIRLNQFDSDFCELLDSIKDNDKTDNLR